MKNQQNLILERNNLKQIMKNQQNSILERNNLIQQKKVLLQSDPKVRKVQKLEICIV